MDLERLPERVNGNPVLVRRGRYLSTDFMIEIGERQHVVQVRDGRIASVAVGNRMPAWSFALRAAEEDWAKFWAPIPAPGYSDIFALVRWKRMRIEGDLQPLMANILYIKDVLASLRDDQHDGRKEGETPS